MPSARLLLIVYKRKHIWGNKNRSNVSPQGEQQADEAPSTWDSDTDLATSHDDMAEVKQDPQTVGLILSSSFVPLDHT
jgi:hypothetical protein